MNERPQAALFEALRTLGYRIDSPNNRLPAVIHGAGPRAGACSVSIDESSQFASALLLCSRQGGWRVQLVGNNAEESPYVVLTEKLLAAFPPHGGAFPIEADASSASYFWAADLLLQLYNQSPGRDRPSRISIRNLPRSGWQIDERFPSLITGTTKSPGTNEAHLEFGDQTISRRTDLGDSIMTAMILAPFASQPIRFIDLARLRVQECERVMAMRTELTKCGAQVVEEGDTLTVSPSDCHGAVVETYDDHRIAMCFAVLSLKVPGIRLRHPACVKKTFPNFFQKLAAPPPHGLGITIRSVPAGAMLGEGELAAE